jgi:5-methylcytosine-specific restriction endonuclease McrA
MVLSKSALRSTGSTRQWRNIRERILRRDGYICQYCGQEADTVDHVIPRRLNGLDTDDNLVSSCRKCNLSKGGRFFVSKRTPPTPRSFSNPQNTSIGHEPTQSNPS